MPGVAPAPRLPEPHHYLSAVHLSRVIGLPEGRTPSAAEGFEVNAFATGFDSPRRGHALPTVYRGVESLSVRHDAFEDVLLRLLGAGRNGAECGFLNRLLLNQTVRCQFTPPEGAPFKPKPRGRPLIS
jgi:hypothetical protein